MILFLVQKHLLLIQIPVTVRNQVGRHFQADIGTSQVAACFAV